MHLIPYRIFLTQYTVLSIKLTHFCFYFAVAAFGTVLDLTPAPEPKINIVVHPPKHVLIRRELPVFLPCVANLTSTDVIVDLDGKDNDDYYEEEEDDRDDDIVEYNREVDNDDDGLNASSLRKRDTVYLNEKVQPSIIYRWYKDGELIQENKRNEYEFYPNGTLRIEYSANVSGEYRCLANATKPGIGAVLSQRCLVETTGKRIYIEWNRIEMEF